MSKEVIRPSQFAHATIVEADQGDLAFNEEQKNELQSLYETFFSACKPGNIVKGVVVEVNNDGIIVDIAYKSNGFIPRYEFSSQELSTFKAGDSIEVILNELENVEGVVDLSYEKAKALKVWDTIMKMFEEEKPVEGEVTHKVKGGLSVDIGIPAFLPGSQVDVQRVSNFDQYVGQKIVAYIIKVNKKRGNVIISRRKFLGEQRSEVRKKIFDLVSEGQVIDGIVKNITNYGAFVDIGGVDGLLHITDMTWGRIAHPSEIMKVGDTVKVKVLSLDKDNEKISLGIKQLSENPWESLKAVTVGSLVKGKIASITDYGLFVEVAKGVEGLIHISEISWIDRINDLNKHFVVGDEVEAVVISFDKDNRRMSLSIKQREKNPWEEVAEKFKPGTVVSGVVSNVTDFGVFVNLKPGIDGLIHVSDLSWIEHIDHPSSLFKRDQQISAVVLSVDVASKKISLGIKQLQQDPWESIEEHYKIGDIIEGEVSKITNFGMFVKLPVGIEGLVHISELNSERKGDERVEDLFKIGQKCKFRVIKVSKEERKLGLSPRLTGEITEEVRREEKRDYRREERSERNDRNEYRRDERSDRSDRFDRSDRPDRSERSDRREPRKEASLVSDIFPKQKTAMQIELEKHIAARNKANSDNSGE